MKRLIFALALAALALPAAPKAQAGVDVSVDFFYNNLGSEGNWIEAGDYGYCWQPSVAVSDTHWRPYSEGSWAYTDVGWTWVSNERFGWATYHYGRWARISGRGWVWVPGREWAPAWVSWRTGGDYVGWAPLPPRYNGGGGEVVYEGRPISGAVDVEFDIGPSYYNFVNLQYLGEPSLRSRIYAPTQNIAYINKTVNVTNITYNNTVVYNNGPDFNRVSAYSQRPIRQLKIQRNDSADFNTVGGSTTVQGDNLVVAAPMTLQKPAQPIAPKVVKEKIAQPKLETGWSNVSDPKAKADLQQKMKTEDAKVVPPPTIKPKRAAALTSPGSDQPAASGAAATPSQAAAGETSPAEGTTGGRNKGKNKPAAVKPAVANPKAAAAPVDSASPAASPLAAAGSQSAKNGKNKQNKGKQPAAPAQAATESVSPGPSPAATSAPADAKQGARGKNKVPSSKAPSKSPDRKMPGTTGASEPLRNNVPAASAKPKGKVNQSAGRMTEKKQRPVAAPQSSAPTPAPANIATPPGGPRPQKPQPNKLDGGGRQALAPAAVAPPERPKAAPQRNDGNVRANPGANPAPAGGQPPPGPAAAPKGAKPQKGDKKKHGEEPVPSPAQ